MLSAFLDVCPARTGRAPAGAMRDSGFMRRPPVIMLIPLAVAAACWVGCSVEKDYKILSFFFEGVPTPEELAAQRAGGPDLASDEGYDTPRSRI